MKRDPAWQERLAREAGLPYIGWRTTRRDGDWVQMRSGCGELGWWHRHEDGSDGTNPGDYRNGVTKCRTCGAVKP